MTTTIETETAKETNEQQVISNALETFLQGEMTVGEAAKLYKVDKTLIYGRCYRVNVWIKELNDDRVVPTFKISRSYFAEITAGGEVVDLTI